MLSNFPYFFPSPFFQAYETQFGIVGDFSCAIFNLVSSALDDTSDMSFASSLTGITVRFIEEDENGNPSASAVWSSRFFLSRCPSSFFFFKKEIELNDLDEVYLEMFITEDSNCQETKRGLSLSDEGDEQTTVCWIVIVCFVCLFIAQTLISFPSFLHSFFPPAIHSNLL